MADIKITGFDDLSKILSGMSDKMAQGSVSSGLRQAANLIRDQAKANFNSAGGPSDLSGALKASIRTTKRRGSPGRVVFSVVAGTLTDAQTKKFGADSAFYALWVEKGHINRKMGQALRGSKESIKAQRAASTSNTPAHPYMRPAIESKAQEAIDLMADTVISNFSGDIS